jgi:hypothetical protein
VLRKEKQGIKPCFSQLVIEPYEQHDLSVSEGFFLFTSAGLAAFGFFSEMTGFLLLSLI